MNSEKLNTVVKDVMPLLSGKWKMQIVSFLLRNGKTRFMDLRRGVAGISSKVLSDELQELEHCKIVSRKVVSPKLISVAYELTKHGKTLETVILTIASWGAAHRRYLSQNAHRASKQP
ncbi:MULTISPECIES: winged helix-turn-helix transcriptional regulator [unclassified Chitinophaga]|uniref:winged helix-turn-helix transcriptional regulator n=1 Tax=unclassified Chitinophaga TaxID=2619133 RepID=UPI00301051BA